MPTKKAGSVTQCAYLRNVIRRVKDGSVVPGFEGHDLCLFTKPGRRVVRLFVHRGEVHKVGSGLVPQGNHILTGSPLPKEETKLYTAKLQVSDGKRRRICGARFEWRFRGNGFAVKDNGAQGMEQESFRLMEELDALMRKRAKLGPRPEFAFRDLTRQWERDPKGTAEKIVGEFAGRWRLVNGEYVSRKNGVTLVIVPGRGTLTLQQHKDGVYDIATFVEESSAPRGSARLWIRKYAEKVVA